MARKPARCRNPNDSNDNCIKASTYCSSTTNAKNLTSSSKSTRTTKTPVAKLLFMIIACCLTLSHAYNIDLPSYTRHMHDDGTMFGFSIAFYKAYNGYPSLIVGAPKFNTSGFQFGVDEGGAVFRCGMNDNQCDLVRFDSQGSKKNTLGDVIERKSHQWLGATVTTSRDNDLVVACAPRYVFHTMTPKKSLRYDPVGTCFMSRNLTQFKEVSPCRTNNWGYHRQGSCQAGFSAAANKDGDRLYIGAPGSWYWQGQIYSVSPDATFPYKPPFYQPFGIGGQTYSLDVTRPENQVYSTSESSSLDDDSYLGYSMITGDFNGDHVEDVAIGMPRGAGLLGKVVVNRWDMVNLFNITGHQIGEYFGYALASGDLDGDGLDDLIIGAPMYTEPGNMEGKYDVGRVYIHLQTSTRDELRYHNAHIRDGTRTKGRFGLSLAYLGDINRDGYGDFAVGAPYDGPHGFGMVYIYHGSKDGPLKKPSQIISAEDLVEAYPYPRTFGFSLAGGVDMDGNTYPDLAVGAYDSSQVYIFKSRPVAGVESSTSFWKQSKLIDIEDKQCRTVRDGKYVACTDLTTCWSYTGYQLPQSLQFNVSWILDAKKQKSPRMFFLEHEGKNVKQTIITLFYGQKYCQNATVYIADNIQDKLTPLEVETRYNLVSSRGLVPSVVSRRRREVLEPVIDENREVVQRDALNIQKNCGSDNICIPDLRLQIKTYDEYLLGSGQPLPIEVLITNRNEDAFEAAYYMTIPKDVDYNITRSIGDKNDTALACTAPSYNNNYTIKCDIGNPFPANEVINFKVMLMPKQKVGMSSSYVFHCVVNSTNEELAGTRIDNEITKEIPLWADTTVSIEGLSLPDFALYKASDYRSVENSTHEDHLGPQVVHLYNIRNNGPSFVEEVVILIHYPHKTISGDMLMYVMNQPETHGNVVCDPHETVNVLNLQWDPLLKRKSYLEQIGAIVRTQAESASSASGAVSSNHEESGVVHIEKPHGGSVIGGKTTFIHGQYMPTEEDTRRYEKEDEQDSTGDASLVHSDRAQKAAAAAAAEAARSAAANSGWSSSSSSSWNSTSGRRPSSVIVAMRNSTTYYDPSGQPHTVETSTEYVRSLERGPGYYEQQRQHSANYQQGGRNIGNNRGAETHENFIATQQPSPIQISDTYNGRDHIQMAGSPSVSISRNIQQSQNADPYRQAHSSGSGGAGGYTDGSTNFHSVIQDAGRGGSGNFRHGTLELAPVGRQNVDQELQQNRFNYEGSLGAGGAGSSNLAGAGGGSGGGSRSYSQSFSTSGNPQTGYQQHAYYQSNSKPYYGRENEDFYDESSNQLGHTQQQTQWPTQRRVKREKPSTATSIPEVEPSQIDLNSPCKAANCKTIRCVAKNLEKEDGVWVGLRVRMVAKTMEKLAGGVPLNVSTMAVTQVVRLPYIGEPKKPIIKTHEIFYKAQPEPTPVPDVVPLWVVVLAACAGALILLLLVFLLYKCGFFNRNRPNNHPERQPLRNGYHGDEHL